jgi:hypothetical protein
MKPRRMIQPHQNTFGAYESCNCLPPGFSASILDKRHSLGFHFVHCRLDRSGMCERRPSITLNTSAS